MHIQSIRVTEPSEAEWECLKEMWRDDVFCDKQGCAWDGYYHETFFAGQAGYCPKCGCSVATKEGKTSS